MADITLGTHVLIPDGRSGQIIALVEMPHLGMGYRELPRQQREDKSFTFNRLPGVIPDVRVPVFMVRGENHFGWYTADRLRLPAVQHSLFAEQGQ